MGNKNKEEMQFQNCKYSGSIEIPYSKVVALIPDSSRSFDMSDVRAVLRKINYDTPVEVSFSLENRILKVSFVPGIAKYKNDHIPLDLEKNNDAKLMLEAFIIAGLMDPFINLTL